MPQGALNLKGSFSVATSAQCIGRDMTELQLIHNTMKEA